MNGLDFMAMLPHSSSAAAQIAPDWEADYCEFTLPPGSRRVVTSAWRVFAFWAVFLPLAFGGRDVYVFLLAQTTVFLALALVLARSRGMWLLDRPAAAMLAGFGLFLLFCLLQYTLLLLQRVPHPVLGLAALHPAPQRFWGQLRAFLFFAACFGTATVLLRLYPAFARKLSLLLVAAGMLVSVVALAHWFYDNGRLLWYFEPQFVFTSVRARWPFVNANHLAHYLLPLVFLALSVVVQRARALAATAQNFISHRPGKTGWSKLLAAPRVHAGILQLAMALIVLFTMLLAFVGALSRGSWLGLSVGLAVLVVLQKLAPESVRDPSRSSFRRRRRRGLARALPRLLRPALVAAALGIFFFFLSGRGAELLEDRIEYGLMHSKEDIRWTMYSDSWVMLRAQPLLGVGFGTWLAHYPRSMASELNGIDPEYLHSDPLQLLVECGLLGTLPLAGAAIVLFYTMIVGVRRASGEARLRLQALCAGLAALAAASFLDFPFKIPAISAEAAMLSALGIFYASSPSRTARLR